MDTNDASLLRRYVESGSKEAFAGLVERYVNLVYGAALRQVAGDVHLAEDVTQTVFILLERKARSLPDHPTLAGWLHASTRLACKDALRSERRRRNREQEAFMMNEVNSPGPTDAGWDRLAPVIDDAVAELDESDREVVLLRYFQGRKFGEVGAALQLSEDAARHRVDRALDKLRTILGRRGINSPTAALGFALPICAGLSAPTDLAARISGAVLGGAAKSGSIAVGALSAFQVAGISATAAVIAVGLGIFGVRGFGGSGSTPGHDGAVVHSHIDLAEQRLAQLEKEPATPVATTDNQPVSQSASAAGANFAVASLGQPRNPPDWSAGDPLTPAHLPLSATTHAVFVIDTSGSMHNPATGQIRPAILEQMLAVLRDNPQVKFVQMMDADGRYVLGSTASGWLQNDEATHENLKEALTKYQIFSNSNPVTGIQAAIRRMFERDNTDMAMSVIVIGDEFVGRNDGPLFASLDDLNPPAADGSRRVSIHGIAFPLGNAAPSMRTTGNAFHSVMERIASEHGGTFIPAKYPELDPGPENP